MTPLADMVRRLGAAGCSLEQIAIEIEAREIERAEKDAARREQERIRKRNQRSRARDSQGLPGTPRDKNKRYPIEQVPRAASLESKKDTSQERSKDLSFEADFVGRIIPDPVYEDAKARLFRVGKDILMMFGIREEKTGALIGRWLKQQPDPAVLLNAIHFARDRNVAEPIAYISTLISNGASNVRPFRGRAPGQSLADLGFQMAEEIREREREIAAAGAGQFSDRS